ncbi:protein S-acyltransferase 11-like isoform X2 [Ananas comosus]|uniref:S-acyltransferase n=1 Tax=Ananas comosus TaxID=4615 RepID=A0A6P5H522_ANACO|nr:protein S-acyltransferase 11-like isoform X2 [Ananas comosus]
MDVKETIEDEHGATTILTDGREPTCWGCGLRLLAFKCAWCGAITQGEQNSRRPDSRCFSRWRRARDRLFAAILALFMLFVICGGAWAVYPVVFAIGFSYGVFHCVVTAILSLITLSTFCFAAFRSAGAPPNVSWGSFPVVVGRNGLNDYTFCAYCQKPKPLRAHHCRSCRACVTDMDHHCPFIGNCVGAANHRFFVAFLISVVVSCAYVVAMATYAAVFVWPRVDLGVHLKSPGLDSPELLKEIVAALATSALFLSARGFLLVYLAFAGQVRLILDRFMMFSCRNRCKCAAVAATLFYLRR